MTKEQKIIRAKVGLLELAKQLGTVALADPHTDGCGGGILTASELPQHDRPS